MNVKICGITNLEDARMAAAAGADYLGFIFYPPSKRGITVEAAQRITAVLREQADCPVLVGVFVNETGPRMAEILAACHLDCAQLSGEEAPALLTDENSPVYGRAYKAIRPATRAQAEQEAALYRVAIHHSPFTIHNSPALLIDSYHPTLRGGTGETGDWALSARLARQIPGLMLAGGLTADNVGEAVRAVRPFAVDVASGVEASPGKKDPDLLYAFVRNAKTAVTS